MALLNIATAPDAVIQALVEMGDHNPDWPDEADTEGSFAHAAKCLANYWGSKPVPGEMLQSDARLGGPVAIIYGSGGGHRYAVLVDGTLRMTTHGGSTELCAMRGHAACLAKALTLGFRPRG
jgi:hypothetical protein